MEAAAERLRARGTTDAELTRLHAPVGLAIGAVTPAEIAVAILAATLISILVGSQAGRRLARQEVVNDRRVLAADLAPGLQLISGLVPANHGYARADDADDEDLVPCQLLLVDEHIQCPRVAGLDHDAGALALTVAQEPGKVVNAGPVEDQPVHILDVVYESRPRRHAIGRSLVADNAVNRPGMQQLARFIADLLNDAGRHADLAPGDAAIFVSLGPSVASCLVKSETTWAHLLPSEADTHSSLKRSFSIPT